MSEAGFTTQFIFSSADHFTAFELPRPSAWKRACRFPGATTYQEFGGSAYKTIGLGHHHGLHRPARHL